MENVSVDPNSGGRKTYSAISSEDQAYYGKRDAMTTGRGTEQGPQDNWVGLVQFQLRS